MLTGVISTKVIAATIGTVGVGLVGNFLNSVAILSLLGTGGIGQGVTKAIAENFDKPEKQQNIIRQAIRITLISTAIVALLVVLFSSVLGDTLFKSQQYRSIIILFGITLILYTVNMLIVSIVNGFKQFKKFISINVVTSIGSLVIGVILVLQYGLYGALISTVLSQTIIVALTFYMVRREQWFRSIFNWVKPDWNVIRVLLSFTLMAVVSILSVQSSQLVVRIHIGETISMADAGIWEAVNRISAMYLMVVTTSISTYYLPRLSEIREPGALRREIFQTMSMLLPAVFAICVVVYLLKDIILRLLFTSDFLPARDLFLFQMIGDFFKIASLTVAFLFWAKAKTLLFILSELVAAGGFISMAFWFTNRFGVVGASYAHALNYAVYFCLVVFIFRKILFTRSSG